MCLDISPKVHRRHPPLGVKFQIDAWVFFLYFFDVGGHAGELFLAGRDRLAHCSGMSRNNNRRVVVMVYTAYAEQTVRRRQCFYTCR